MYAKFPSMFVGVDAHIDPRAVTNSPKISKKTVRFAGAMWASPPTNPKESAFLNRKQQVAIGRHRPIGAGNERLEMVDRLADLAHGGH